MPPLYIPKRTGADALLELDQVEWQPLAGALGPMNVPKLLTKLTSESLDTRDEVISSLEYCAEYRSETSEQPTTAQMIPFLLAMTADSTVVWRRETMRAAVFACMWALKARRASVLSAAEASERWLKLMQTDPSDAIAYGAKLMSTIHFNMTNAKLRDDLVVVDGVLGNEAYNEELNADRAGPPLPRARLQKQVDDFDWTHTEAQWFAVFLARDCNRAGAFDLTLQLLERVNEPSLQYEVLQRRFEALHGLGRIDEATKLAHEQTRVWFAPHDDWTIRAPQVVSMLSALNDPTSVELLEKVKTKARREIQESDNHELMKAHLIRLDGLE